MKYLYYDHDVQMWIIVFNDDRIWGRDTWEEIVTLASEYGITLAHHVPLEVS